MIRKTITILSVPNGALGDRQIRVRASDGSEDEVKDILVPRGCRVGPSIPVLLDHDATVDNIVGRGIPTITDTEVDTLINFLPVGMTDKADMACAKYKHGFGNAVSVGFTPIDYEKRSGGGYLFKEWRLEELSLVVLGANRNAVVTEKGMPMTNKSGRVISAATRARLQEAIDQHDEGMRLHRAALACHRECAKIMRELADTGAIDGEGDMADLGPDDGNGVPQSRSARIAQARALARPDDDTREGRLAIAAALAR